MDTVHKAIKRKDKNCKSISAIAGEYYDITGYPGKYEEFQF